MRARYMVRGKNSPPQNDSSIPCPPKKPSTRKALKTNSADLEAILSTVEKELFINIKANYVKDNLTKDERRSLTTWKRDVLLIQTAVYYWNHRFVVVDKQTDIVETNDQKGRSSFVKLNYDPTKEFI